ncbi:MAG: hypothetical protein A2Y22_06130 [Clostridiales bacterium GWD2_32_59]|nr:MAG: hypothetical protein A2Y22_06130 [Clostridiales bacterium GWD2_32_59]
MITKEEIKKLLIDNDALFKNIYVIEQKFNILPDNKNHIGASIDYKHLKECREGFLDELYDTIVEWVYSTEKYKKLVKEIKARKSKTDSAIHSEINRDAHLKFRKSRSELIVQGQIGELILFHFLQKVYSAVPILRKMVIKTSPKHEVFGADAIHYTVEDDKNIIYLGESKAYTSKYKFNEAFEDALGSIINTYENLEKELRLYIHEDFLDSKMCDVANAYIDNTLSPVEIRLVNLIMYNETKKIDISIGESEIREQIKKIIEDRFSNFDNSKIDVKTNPILKGITYIVFPIWEFGKLAQEFSDLIGG